MKPFNFFERFFRFTVSRKDWFLKGYTFGVLKQLKIFIMTTIYKRSDLYYDDYKWTAYPDDDPKVTGTLDSSRFSRYEGYEVLYFINKFANDYGLSSTSDGRKIELIIRKHLPSNIIMQIDVKNWVAENWSKY